MKEITVNITSCGRWSDLNRLLRSLSNIQGPIQIALTQDVEVPIELQSITFKTCYSNAPSARNALWKKTLTPLALFLDEDCEIFDSNYFEKINNAIRSRDCERIALGGNYQSAKQQNFLQKAYNFVTQLWTLRNTESTILFLGGHFVLYQKSGPKSPLFNEDSSFGGEEFSLLRNLRSQNFTMQWLPQLIVNHYPSASWLHFFARAKQHANGPSHPEKLNKIYFKKLLKLFHQADFSTLSFSLFYLFLVYLNRLFFKAILMSESTRRSKVTPELRADRTKSSVGSKFGLALASKKNK